MLCRKELYEMLAFGLPFVLDNSIFFKEHLTLLRVQTQRQVAMYLYCSTPLMKLRPINCLLLKMKRVLPCKHTKVGWNHMALQCVSPVLAGSTQMVPYPSVLTQSWTSPLQT